MPQHTFTRLAALGLLLLLSTVISAETAPKVVLETNHGKITLELFADKAPQTTANFLSYVDKQFYVGLIFHRVIKGFMIQGGGFGENMQRRQTQPPIKNEASNGLSNIRGTIAMARTGAPHSATSQFFINTVDNTNLDFRMPAANGWGYCVFGRVIEGMDVVDNIESSETGSKGHYSDVPLKAVIIQKVYRLELEPEPEPEPEPEDNPLQLK